MTELRTILQVFREQNELCISFTIACLSFHICARLQVADQCEDFFAGDILQMVKDLTDARLNDICRYDAWTGQCSAE